MPEARPPRPPAAAGTALALAATLGGCGLITAETGPNTLTVADYYTAEPGNTALTEIVDVCGERLGVEVEREVMPRSQLVPKLLRDGAADTLPDLVLSDNPDLAKLASTGALLPLDGAVDTEGFYDSVLDTGRYRGELYGVAPGVNGLALFYDRRAFEEAGLRPPTTWEELRDAADRLTSGHRYGLALSAIGTEEGVWQFEPFLWGAGGELTDLDSPAAIEALTFWGALFEDGSVSASALNWAQSDVAEQFIGGHAAMMINGSWQLAALDAHEDLDYGVVPLPTRAAGDEPATPMGGETWAVPRGERQDTAVELLNCVLEPGNMLAWAQLRADVPSHPDVAAELLAREPDLEPFVAGAPTARSRTVELGTRYPTVSQEISTALHEVATGGREPAEALAEAQRRADSADD